MPKPVNKALFFKLVLAAAVLISGPAMAKKPPEARKKQVPVIVPEEKKDEPPAAATTFQEIDFGKGLVIEGKVEKPQVQFPLLKEPPPEKEIQFETSFLQNILKLDRENTFKAGERYGRD